MKRRARLRETIRTENYPEMRANNESSDYSTKQGKLKKKSMQRYIVMKLQKTRNKGKILKTKKKYREIII